MTARAGFLSELQVHQLKMWPLVLLPHAKTCEVRFECHPAESDERNPEGILEGAWIRKVEFRVVTNKRKKPPAKQTKRLRVLCEAVTAMLGLDFEVTVWINGVRSYRSAPQEEPNPYLRLNGP